MLIYFSVTLVNDKNPSSKVVFDIFHWSKATCEWAFKEAGFSSFEWISLRLQKDDSQSAYWEDWLKAQPLIGFRAMK
jgi:hypothetical protein